jgi:hypothetical protein
VARTTRVEWIGADQQGMEHASVAATVHPAAPRRSRRPCERAPRCATWW